MPVTHLNNVTVSNVGYVDALTVVFPLGRASFALHVFNAAVFYQLATTPMTGKVGAGQTEWEFGEHYLTPSLSTFRDPVAEGLPAGRLFAGVRIRSAVDPVPSPAAAVTVA